MNRLLKLVFAACLFVLARPASSGAQPFAVPWHKIGSGGGTSSGATFAVAGTIGQPDAGPLMTSGAFTVTGGYWAANLLAKATAVVTFSNLTQAFDGTAKAVSVTTIPAGLAVIVTYNGSTAAPTNIGSYAVIGVVNDPVFQGGATNTFIIDLAIPRNLGVDVSHFDDETGIPETNWVQMFSQSNRFVFVKASEGLTGPDDPTMATNVANATQAGLLVGVYHFAHPENRPTTNGAIMEADHLLTYAGSAIGPGMLRPVLDLETTSSNLPPSVMTDWVIAFCQEIVNNRGTGAMPIIYCTQFFANEQFDSRLANFSLWLRDIGGNPAFDQPATNGFPSALGVFANWSFWQYSSSGTAGGISPIDLDVCHDEFLPLASYIIPATPGNFAVTKATVPRNFTVTKATPTATGMSFALTNTPGTHFTLLTSTDLNLPLNQWKVVGAFQEISPGNFQAMDVNPVKSAMVFYRVRSP